MDVKTDSLVPLIEKFEKAAPAVAHKVPHPTSATETLTMLEHAAGRSLADMTAMTEKYREFPRQRSGIAVLSDISSLAAHVNRFKTAESALFGDKMPTNPSLLAVFDYHDRLNAGEDEAPLAEHPRPRFGKHCARYEFPLSVAWRAWNAINGKSLEQGSFAALIEERILDIAPPPVFTEGTLGPTDAMLREITRLTHGSWAGPERMMDLSRGLAVHESSKLVSATNISSGTGTLIYETEHTDEQGMKLEVPNLFLLALPPFEGGAPYRVPARLRYRKNAGRLTWTIDLYQVERIIDAAITEACEEVQQATGLPIFYGTPETIR